MNDVILAIIAGAVKRWLEHSHGPNLAIRVKVPVSLHRKQEAEPVVEAILRMVGLPFGW